MLNYETDVVVIGGGATGAGIVRDCALRGLKAVLVERYDIATGATGRNHGLLHSGARYAVTDPISAKECIDENNILKKIASHCVEECEGLFLTLPEDDINFQPIFIDACYKAGIPAQTLEIKQALHMEPSANPSILGAIKVPDGAIDPFRLVLANCLDAKQHNAQILTYHKVTGLIKAQDKIIGVQLYDCQRKEQKSFYAKIVINAGGIWGQEIVEYADIKLKMFPAKGALLILGHRLNNIVLNRCRKPSDADILVPGDTISLIGTTSTRIPYAEIDNIKVTTDEVDLLLREGDKLAPQLSKTRILRAYAGVRPLVASDDDPTGRNVSRGIVLLDHQERDGLDGFITITGGKLITYRLMAEWATNLICRKLSINRSCSTATQSLPGSQQTKKQLHKKTISLSTPAMRSALFRHGEKVKDIPFNKDKFCHSLVCECEAVSVAEVTYAVENLHINNLIDLRRRTRVGMGTCQGELCGYRAIGLLSFLQKSTTQYSLQQLAIFLDERWKGIRPIAWGDTLRESEFTHWLYRGVCGLTSHLDTEDNYHEI